MIIEMFAIRHNPTGYYLHASSRGRGMTHREPEELMAYHPREVHLGARYRRWKLLGW
jgi:hypothetical protein